ncbi:hypothetical protein ONZ45_g6317 [Pleurotus djamor]|nr:hypothetical protein ONZ45_g6317 [Pleurotus djamor]
MQRTRQLPHELLLHIIEFIDVEDKGSLFNLLLSCRTLHTFAEPRFYCDVSFIETPDNSSHLLAKMATFYAQILKQNARLSLFVRQFSFSTAPYKPTPDDVIVKILPLLINLDSFRFSCPDGRNIPSTSILRFLRSPKLQTLIWGPRLPEERIGVSEEEFSQLFIANEAHLTLKKFKYFSISRPASSFHFVDNVFDLFKSIPSLRVFDFENDGSPTFTRYYHSGHSVVMPLPGMFRDTWPSEHELSHILQGPAQTATEY